MEQYKHITQQQNNYMLKHDVQYIKHYACWLLLCETKMN